MKQEHGTATTNSSRVESRSTAETIMAPACTSSSESPNLATRRCPDSSGAGAPTDHPVSSQSMPHDQQLLAPDEAPPELDALRPSFSRTTRIPARRGVPVTLAPVGVGSNDPNPARLPSLSSATSSGSGRTLPPATASAAVAASDGWGAKHWPVFRSSPSQWRHPTGQYGGDLGSTTTSSTPAQYAIGMRSRTDTDPGPSRTLLEAAKIAAAAVDGFDSPDTRNQDRHRYHGPPPASEGCRRTATYIQNRSISIGEEPSHQVAGVGQGSGESRQAATSPSGGREFTDSTSGRGGGDDGLDGRNRTEVEGKGLREGEGEGRDSASNVIVERVGGTDDTDKRCGRDEKGGGSSSSNSGAGSGGGSGGTARVRIRGGGIDITSLLSEDTDADSGSTRQENCALPYRDATVDQPGGGESGDGTSAGEGAFACDASSSTSIGYQRQDSAGSVSSVGGDFSYSSTGGGNCGGGSRAGTPHAHTGNEHFRGDGPGGRPPLVRKRSLTVALDADPTGPALCPSPRGRRRSVDKALDTKEGVQDTPSESPACPPRVLPAPAVNSSGVITVGSSGGSGGGCFSPHPAYPSPRASKGGVGPRECPLSSPHERFHHHPHHAMDMEWIPSETTHTAALSASTAATPSPVPSASSGPAGSVLGCPQSPFAPSPGQDYPRIGGMRGAPPQSPSPRRAPPSPAQAPGSAGLRRPGTRRLDGRKLTRRVHSMGGGRGGVYAGGGAGEIISGGGNGGIGPGGGIGGSYESDYDSDLSDISGYSAVGSLERQLQQDTFFELDETLWQVVSRREICNADKCVYRNPKTMVSVRKHYHATCSHIHQEGVKKGMRFHHHQLEKVKKHQRSHNSHLARVPREQGMASPPAALMRRARSLDAQSSRDGISSGGEDEVEEEEPWSAHEMELLENLVRSYGTGRWEQVSGNFAKRNSSQCARQWALRSRAHSHSLGSSGPIIAGEHHHQQYQQHHVTRPAVHSVGAGGLGLGVSGGWSNPHHFEQHQMTSADGVVLGMTSVGATSAAASATADASARVPVGFSTPARPGRGVPQTAGAGMVPFGSPGVGVGGSVRGPKGVGSWTKEEDDRLNALVATFGVKWSQIAEHMPGRVGKQCRERYLNHLDPNLRHGPWTEEEEALLLSLHARLKNQWAEIARQIPGRSDNDVKNRWNLVCRRERAAEKTLQRANSSGTASSTAPVTPARLSRALSSGAVETSVTATAAGAGRVATAAPVPVPVVQGESPRGDQTSGGYSGGGVEGDGGRAVSLEEKQKSIIEAREEAEAGAGLVKLSLTSASTARAALEHSNFDSGGTAGGGVGIGGVTVKRPPTSPVSPRYSLEQHQQIPMVSPRFSRGQFHQHPYFHQQQQYQHQQQEHQQQHHYQQQQHANNAASPPAGCASPRFSRRDGHPPRSPPLAGESMTSHVPGYRGGGNDSSGGGSEGGERGDGSGGGGGGGNDAPPHVPLQAPYSPRHAGHPPPLAVPRSPASESVRNAVPVSVGSGGSVQASSGVRRAQGVAADVDSRKGTVSARAGAGGGVATWSWGRM